MKHGQYYHLCFKRFVNQAQSSTISDRCDSILFSHYIPLSPLGGCNGIAPYNLKDYLVAIFSFFSPTYLNLSNCLMMIKKICGEYCKSQCMGFIY